MKKKIFKRVASLALAVVMVLSVLVLVNPQEAKAADKAFSAGTGTVAVDITDDDLSAMKAANDAYTYIAFTPAQTGYVSFAMSNISSAATGTNGSVALCDASKNPISSDDKFASGEEWAYTVTYGVKANTSYYLRVNCQVKGTKVTATFVKQNKSKKNSKKKAVEIKANKAKSGVMIAGENKADWYKINLKNSKKLKLTFNVKSHGIGDYGRDKKGVDKYDGIKFSFYDSNGKLWTKNAYCYVSRLDTKGVSFTFYTTINHGTKKYGIPAGTYYVKVERANAQSSGYYTLKWK